MQVRSDGMVCSVSLLFFMLILVFTCILLFNWKMTKLMGLAMFFFYFVFVIISLCLTWGWLVCPIEL